VLDKNQLKKGEELLADYNRRKLKELESDLTKASDKNKGMIHKEKEEREEAMEDLKSFENSFDEVLRQSIDPVIDDGVLANISPFQKAGLLAMGVLDKNQLKKGEELLADYIEERRQKK
jgi:isopentenyl diphosphate isomerase/L-lactate dehydrogenase-like FMN-dependent dehydrogenase